MATTCPNHENPPKGYLATASDLVPGSNLRPKKNSIWLADLYGGKATNYLSLLRRCNKRLGASGNFT
jgi:hypothetical protein